MDQDDRRELLKETNFGKAELEALFASYKRQASNEEIGLTKDEYITTMKLHGLEDDVFLENMWLNSSSDNVIDFKQVATCLSVLLRGSTTDMAEFEFNVWDTNNDGELSLQEFLQFYKYAKSMAHSANKTDDALTKEEGERAFAMVDKAQKGFITVDEFTSAIEDYELKVGDPFHAFVFDPLNHRASKGAIAGFSAEERALFHLMGERINIRKGKDIPHNFTDAEGHATECFYILVEGQVECKYQAAATATRVAPGMDGFLYDDSVFIRGMDAATTKSAKALKDSVLIRMGSADFMQAYLSDTAGASSIFKRIKKRMRDALAEDDGVALLSPSVNMNKFMDKKKSVLHSSGKVLTPENINKNLVEMQYAVRGLVPITAERIQQEIASGKSRKHFKEILYCNIGNPHSVGQKPITFYREVLALVDCPTLLDKPNVGEFFPSDVIERARDMLKNIKGGTGAYSHSQGILSIRNNVAKFIEKRDGHPCKPGDLFLTNGASSGIQMILSTLLAQPNDAVLIPIPQYPIYSALIKLLNGQQAGYHMDEASGWSLDMAELRKSVSESRSNGNNPKALVVINPGNPVGNCLSYDNLVDLVQLCREQHLVLLADEVYQDNIYMDRPFVSIKKVVRDLGPDYEGFELVSFHSTSKGIIGECGRRGGYMELCGFDAEVQAQIYKLASSGLCSNIDGQVMMDLMVKPPLPEDPSYPLFKQETGDIFEALKRKSQILHKELNDIEGITCQPLQGAMYAFPAIKLPPKAIAAAEQKGHAPDTFYALSLLEITGICAVPGSGFGQKVGTYHIRMTFLPSEEKLVDAMKAFRKHHEDFMAKYKD